MSLLSVSAFRSLQFTSWTIFVNSFSQYLRKSNSRLSAHASVSYPSRTPQSRALQS